MRKIAVIGAGPAGCILSFGLLKAGFDVTLYSDRTPDQWLNHSKPTGSAYLYDETIDIERLLDMDHWADKAFCGVGFLLDVWNREGKLTSTIVGRSEFGRKGTGIDQRMRVSRWLDEIESRGGRLVIESVTPERLDQIAKEHDLAVLAAGKADLASLIPRNAERSVYDKPQRNLAMSIVTSKTGKLHEWFSDRSPFLPVKFNQYPGVGEYFWVPYEHKTAGASFAILLEAQPGSTIDRFNGLTSGEEVTKAACDVIRETSPHERHIADDMQYVDGGDEHAWLTGRFPPTVRHAFAKLPSGGYVIPVGDTAIAFDPVCGQGGQFASRSAYFLAQVLTARGDQPYDEAWLTQVNEDMWENFGRRAYAFNNHFLEPLEQHGLDVFGVAERNPEAADVLFNGFVRPERMLTAMKNPAEAAAFVSRYS